MFKDLKLYITHNEFAYGEFQQRKETEEIKWKFQS